MIFRHGVADVEGGAAGQDAFFQHMIDNDVGQRNFHIVHAVDAEQAANSPLDSDGGMNVNELLHIVGDLGSAGAGFRHQLKIQIQFAFHTSPF